MSAPLLEIEHLTLSFGGAPQPVLAGVDLSVSAGEIVGLVGESGSGKSITASAVLGLTPPGARLGGAIRFDGQDILGRPAAAAALRGRAIGFVPQEPMTALNPTLRVSEQLTGPIRHLTGLGRRDAEARAAAMLARMHVADPERVLRAYPFELSGGLRQRALLANAFMLSPRLILADEPTTALDVTVQAEVLDILRACAREEGAAVLFITHNMGVVWRLCDTVQVMRRGEIVERGPARAVLAAPAHPYTRALLDALPERAAYRRPIGARS